MAPDTSTEKTAKPYSLIAISIFDTHALRARTMLRSVLFKVWQGQERGGSRLGGTQLLAFTTGTAPPCPYASFNDTVDVFFITAAHTPQWNNTAKQLHPQLQRTISWNPGEEHCRRKTGLWPPFWPVWTPLKAEQQATYTPEVIRSTYHHPGRMLTSQSRHTHTHREPGSSQISK